MYCPKCGAEIPDDALFCQNCGTKVEPKNVPREEKKTEVTEPVKPPVEQAEPVKVQNTKKPNGSNKKLIAIIVGVLIIIVLVVVLIIVFAGSNSDSASNTNTGTNQTTANSLRYATYDDPVNGIYYSKCQNDLCKRLGISEDQIFMVGFCENNGIGVSAHNSLCFVVGNLHTENGETNIIHDSDPVDLYEYVDIKVDANGNLLPGTYKGKTKTYSAFEDDENSTGAYWELSNIPDFHDIPVAYS